ncbi:GIY-YIG nuclease family protein [Gelidibacter pelagius]|uniref:GIY-YIG nuclease family protein n=1 Tax=Gelidibacter pelagius TaxID=2819985 RepID=A0ABS3SQ59_9FLAO|nr:GIY-YIG nuclease family protein [Gelidibacter pelagius]MBO3097847.1 GIY-YIG nuclease family protein [Gelidibacter pelagius]
MIKIYVLKLEDNKYYVGQSTDTENRLKYHLKGKLGSEWTKKHKPLEEVEKIETNFTEVNEAMFLENSITIHYMKKYGWKNVRGGDYCTLDEERLRFLLCNNSDLGNEIIPILNKSNYNLNMYGVFIFTLKLQRGNYFIGKTKNLKIGVLKEFNGKGNEWCSMHKPLELTSVINVSKYPEEEQNRLLNNQVVKLMTEENWSKIRGGEYFRVCEENHRNKVMANTKLAIEPLPVQNSIWDKQ